MQFRLRVRYQDGTGQSVAGDFADLREACREALSLADRLGDPSYDPEAQAVECYVDDVLEISIGVIPGGLDPSSTG